MADRVSSDHPSVETHRVTLARAGRTDRPVVEVPGDVSLPTDEVVRLVVDGDERFARPERPLTGDGAEIRGVYDSPDLARSDDGENRLTEWSTSADIDFDSSVLLDVVEAGFKYGLREPGTRVTYEATEAPDDGLAAIARDLEDDS